MKKDKTWLFVLLLSITAITIAGTAAYFSVFGLSKLFAGAGISALILFGSLEFGKVVSVSVLYRFWEKFSIFIRTVFTMMVIGIMLITSLGIYGFLRNSYDSTSNEYNINQKKITLNEAKIKRYQIDVDRFQIDIDNRNNQINSYINNRTTQEQLVSSLYNKSTDTTLTSGERWRTNKNANDTRKIISGYDNNIKLLNEKNNKIYSKINILNDSITNIEKSIIGLETSDISVEIGPLKYLSDLTGKSMDSVVGILIFLIIFVFDPFAIILIIAANELSMNKNNNYNINYNNDNNNDNELLKNELLDFRKDIKSELNDLNNYVNNNK